jgi:hypothetical protein
MTLLDPHIHAAGIAHTLSVSDERPTNDLDPNQLHALFAVGAIRRSVRMTAHCLGLPCGPSFLLSGNAWQKLKEVVMDLARNIMWGVASLLLVLSAGCATNTPPTGLSEAAERLDMSARAFAAHSDTVGPPYQADAQLLARRAYDFRSMVDTATVNNADVSAQFELVSESYHKVSDDVDHARTQQAYSDLEPVTAAYREVRHELDLRGEAPTSG